MKYPEERFLFTIREAAHACGASRATLLRMEESGFLTPYYIDDKTGYRYYDAQNIAQIGQYQLLQELDLTRSEITDIYYQNIDISEFIRIQREKIYRLQRLLNTLEIRTTQLKDRKISFIDLPKITCYCKTESNHTLESAETFAYITHQQAIKEGYRMLGKEPMFLFAKTHSPHAFEGEHPENEITVCLPVVPTNSSDSNLQTFPKCRAFSLIGYGEYSVLYDMFQQFREEIAIRKLEPIGPPRIITHVATYVGSHISQDDFCYELVIPIKSTN